MRIKLLRKILRGKVPGMSMSDMSIEAPMNNLTSMPAGPQKFALILSQEAKRLLAMDRYEQRALLRRNTAIRELDERHRQQN
jgi:hypothetical protein